MQPGRLKELGAHGVIHPTANVVQVVVGPAADQVAGAIRAYVGSVKNEFKPENVSLSFDAAGLAFDLPTSWSAALGGAENVRKAESLAGRLRIEVIDRGKVDADRLSSLDLRAVVWVSANVAHVLAVER